MVLLHLLAKKRDVIAVHYRHMLSDTADAECKFVMDYCNKNSITLVIGNQDTERGADLSREEYWRKGRYNFFKKFNSTVAIGTTLDDAVEWYILSSLHGLGKYIEYSHANVVRPFIHTKKADLIAYAKKHGVPYLEDESNADVNFAARNRVRHNIVPEALKVNPGLYKVVKKRIIEKMNNKE